MQDSILGSWRDAAIILLVLETAVLVVIPGVVLFFAVRGMRWVNRKIRTPLLTARVWALRVQLGTEHASRAAVRLPIALKAVDARTRGTVRSLVDLFQF
jgi:hypothetical protein